MAILSEQASICDGKSLANSADCVREPPSIRIHPYNGRTPFSHHVNRIPTRRIYMARLVPYSIRVRNLLLGLVFSVAMAASHSDAQTRAALTEKIQSVMSRPVFAHSNFGIEFLDLQSGEVIYSLNADKLFVPASTTKLLTEGTLLAKLGADYRFHTRVYRTGPVDSKGRLKGDVVLVASGDPNLSNRIQPDGTLAFVDEDHSYNGPAVSGDPLATIKKLAKDVAAKGIRRING